MKKIESDGMSEYRATRRRVPGECSNDYRHSWTRDTSGPYCRVCGVRKTAQPKRITEAK